MRSSPEVETGGSALMAFTENEVLVLLELDFDLDPECPLGWSRLRRAAWWAALTVGSAAATLTFLQAEHGALLSVGG